MNCDKREDGAEERYLYSFIKKNLTAICHDYEAETGTDVVCGYSPKNKPFNITPDDLAANELALWVENNEYWWNKKEMERPVCGDGSRYRSDKM